MLLEHERYHGLGMDGCSGHRMLLEDERKYGYGMDAQFLGGRGPSKCCVLRTGPLWEAFRMLLEHVSVSLIWT